MLETWMSLRIRLSLEAENKVLILSCVDDQDLLL
jgi:hypothetical protein